MQHLIWQILSAVSMLVIPTLASECQELSLPPLCANYSYSHAWFPNKLNDESAEEAGLEMHQFFPLVKVECSPSLGRYLCLTYFPPCQQNDTEIILPCRELCTAARTGCEPLMNEFGFSWPTALSCDKLPAIADGATCRNNTDGPPITPDQSASIQPVATDLADGDNADTTAPSEQCATSSGDGEPAATPAGQSHSPAADVDSQQLQRTLEKLEQAATALTSFLEKAEPLIPRIDRYITQQNRVLHHNHYG